MEVAHYSLDSALDNGNGATAVAKTMKLAADYTGEIVYENGVSGKAVKTGDYGLLLNEKNIGKRLN